MASSYCIGQHRSQVFTKNTHTGFAKREKELSFLFFFFLVCLFVLPWVLEELLWNPRERQWIQGLCKLLSAVLRRCCCMRLFSLCLEPFFSSPYGLPAKIEPWPEKASLGGLSKGKRVSWGLAPEAKALSWKDFPAFIHSSIHSTTITSPPPSHQWLH